MIGRPLTYLSVCSGIEAASAAWEPLGWRPLAFSEIERFPCEVLAHHYGANLPGEPLATNGVPNLGDMTKFQEWPDYADVDLLVGGTPCQSFSLAGLRKGLADPRGNLALTYLGIADRYKPRWVLWENVPGVISSWSSDVTEDDLREGERREVVETSDFGCFLAGLQEFGYGVAYRILDAQYVRVDGYDRAVPQRRERVFVVGYLGDWRRAAAVLFDGASLRGDPAPRREAGQSVATTISARTKGGGGLGTDFDCDGGLIVSTGDVAHTLRGAGYDASDDGTGRGTPLVPICFSSKDYGNDAQNDVAPTLRRGGQLAIAIQERAVSENLNAGPGGKGFQEEVAYTLEARNKVQAVAFDMRDREGGAQFEGPHDTANIRAASGGSSRSYIAERWAVRRLTPLECERLQGFPDGYTNIPRANGKPAADGNRYKALGNSMAINVMRWIGRRIEAVEAMEPRS